MARGRNEGTISTRKDREGKITGYQAQVSVPGTSGKRRKTATFKTKTEARAWMDGARQAARQGRLTAERTQTLNTYLTSWLGTQRHQLKPRTVEAYELNARRLTVSIGAVRLDMLRAAHLRECYDLLLDGGLSPRTVRQVHMVIHKALKDALRLGLVGWNAADAVDAPRAERKEMKTYTSEQLAQLFAATRSDRFGPLWVLLTTTGLRIGEALGLKWEDIDLTRGTMQVRRALQRQQGVGLVLTSPKSPRALRTVYLGSLAVAGLQAHGERQRFDRRKAAKGWQDNDLVFCTAFGTPLDRGRVHLNWVNAAKSAGLSRIRLHDTRHTAASLMLLQGVHPKVVQEMLGHSSIAITLDTYSHVMPAMHRTAADRLDALLAGHAASS